MKRAVKWLACLGFVLGSVTASGIKVQAAAEPPAHIKKMDGIFEIKEGSTSSVDENGIVTITPNTSNSIGSIWSTNNNLLDFTKSFHLSTYLYFGENVANVGDGMALVFQAVTDSPTWFTSNASSIGYLGEQRNENSVGILNSLAIEFDLFSNITDNDGWFDQNLPTTNKGQHIAYTWPGDLTEYTSWWAWFNTQRAIAHHDPLSYLLTDDKWIRLDVDWDVESKQFQYVIDNSTVVNVPYEELYNRVLATNTQVYWGFTGSTGTYAAPQKVVFQEVPNLVEVDPKIEVYNESRTQEVLDGDEVHTNETLRFDYSVEYLGGKQNWEKVKAIFTGDPNFVLEPGSITATAFIGGQAQSYSLDDSILVDGILNFPVEGTTGRL
ncbi:L-type lectin-domain containing protein [Listeria aquatica]|uniref:L-type lectin-domain containing protein n=1 Tax=Listeria aquatica TaxID=1494960 RepID=UPI0031F58A5E